eukprot:6533120-Pyramimonas_sp.AAC.1
MSENASDCAAFCDGHLVRVAKACDSAKVSKRVGESNMCVAYKPQPMGRAGIDQRLRNYAVAQCVVPMAHSGR